MKDSYLRGIEWSCKEEGIIKGSIFWGLYGWDEGAIATAGVRPLETSLKRYNYVGLKGMLRFTTE